MTDRPTTALDTLLIGLDGANFRVLDPLFESGELPHLARIFDNGVSGTLESQVPPWTASAWPSLYTGTNPGKHGVFGFLDFDGYDWDVVNASHLEERTLWEYLDHDDRTSVVVNAPVTYPPTDIDGAIIPGYLAPEDPECHPSGILDDVADAIGNYRVYASLESDDGATTAERVAEYRELAAMRGEAFRYLADRFDPEFGFLQFQHTDTVLHEFPEDRDSVGAVYGAVDEQVGAVLEATDPETVIVVSDHGLGPYEKRVRINELLRDEGFVESVQGGEGMPTWASIRNDRLVDGHDGGRRESGWIERVMATGASVGLTAQRIGTVLDRLGLKETVERHVPASLIRAASEQVDFPRSTAYVRSRVECGIRINLEGREPNGVVPQSEYESVRADLLDLLSGLEAPDGKPVFEEVAPREEYFHGPETERAVDVVTIPRNYDYYVTSWLMGEYFDEPEPPGWDHKRDGVIAAMGEGIETGANLGDAHLFDVAPTVLATLGLPRSERMDGHTLPIVEDTGKREYPSFDGTPMVSVEDDDVEARLANLGYIE